MSGLGGTAKGMTQLVLSIVICMLIASKFLAAVEINATEDPVGAATLVEFSSGFWDAFGLWPIVLIVIMAVVLLKVSGKL